MNYEYDKTTEPQNCARPSDSQVLVECADCDYRHYKSERIKKKGKVWTTYHCPKCASESMCSITPNV